MPLAFVEQRYANICNEHWIGSYLWQVVAVWHNDVIKWKHFPRYWPFIRGIHRSPVNFAHKGQWRGALMGFFYLRLNKRLSKQSRGYRAHYDVTVMISYPCHRSNFLLWDMCVLVCQMQLSKAWMNGCVPNYSLHCIYLPVLSKCNFIWHAIPQIYQN